MAGDHTLAALGAINKKRSNRTTPATQHCVSVQTPQSHGVVAALMMSTLFTVAHVVNDEHIDAATR